MSPATLPPEVFHLLVALADGPAHGYGLMQAVEKVTAGTVRIQTGALYRHLRRMLREGWIDEAEPADRSAPDDERRKYYRVTAAGRRIAALEAERMRAAVATAAAARLVGGES